ncbi:methyl-accepting chemotaxis protein [Uliginosibacterium gangwonense]|uniref:methyl-accepting chemotaxis protein n=1 Tax=Uliginosibacterium gangwonense TaxID=392736 RepID=UPI00037A802B|nr:methyl-accepting chemotaxis protein [Uliginosibacterium gangwonense]
MSMTIARRLALMSAIGLIAVLSVGAVGLIQMSRIQTELNTVLTQHVPAIRAANRVQLAFQEVRRASVLYSNAPSDQVREVALKQLKAGIANQRERFQQLGALASSEQEKALNADEAALSAQYLELTENLMQALASEGADRPTLISKAVGTITPTGIKLLAVMEKHAQYYEDLMSHSVENSTQRYRQAIWATVLCTLLALVVLALWSLSVYRRVVVPLAGVRDVVTKVEAEKDFSIQAKAGANDEVGQVLSAFNRLLQAMRRDIQAMGRAAHGVSSSAHALLATSESLSTQVTTQSDAAATIAAAMEEMTVSVSVVANQAHEAKEASSQAGEMARNGGEVIAQTAQEIDHIAAAVTTSAERMGELEEHSQRINSVVAVIRDVADQTNLLALNAAIEAARAGESGRGFAVVADEVRKLAERTALSTREIGDTVNSIQQSATQVRASMQDAVESVGRGVQRAHDASGAIDRISQRAAESMRLVTEITTAISEQSAGLTQIARQVEVIAQMAEKNHTTANHSAEEARELDTLAEHMQHTTSQYKV